MDDDYVFALGAPLRLAEYLSQADIGQGLTPQAEDADGFTGYFVLGKLDALADHLERNDIGLVVRNYRKAIDDRQGEGQPNRYGRALAFGTLNVNIAAQ